VTGLVEPAPSPTSGAGRAEGGGESATLHRLFQTHPLPRLEQLALAAHALGAPRSWLLAHDTDGLTSAQTVAVAHALQRRAAGEPVAYITGQRAFYGLNFTVSPAVLIPRAETELLVDWLVEHAPQGAALLDLGTGSGAIAIATAQQRPDLTVCAADISPAALALAAQNNAALAGGRVQLRRSDWCSAYASAGTGAGELFDVIVSNPPYIAADDAHLAQGDLRHEPAGALTDFGDGLAHYRSIAVQAKAHLRASGTLVLEHGWQQGAAIAQLLAAAGYCAIEQHYDAAGHGERGHPRMIVARV
jgi:release factor glutamine methyltransferase